MSTLDNLIKARDDARHALETETMTDEVRERLENIAELSNQMIEIYGEALEKWSLEVKEEAERRKNA